MLVSTLKNYFLGRKELFKGLAINNLESEWTVYPVFHLDFNGSNFIEKGILEKRLHTYVKDWESEYGLVSDTELLDLGGRFLKVLSTAHKQTGLDARYEALCGITQKKIDSCFTDAISELAEEYNCSFEEMRAQLKRQYDDPLSARNIIQ